MCDANPNVGYPIQIFTLSLTLSHHPSLPLAGRHHYHRQINQTATVNCSMAD
jgi:hypothetical protein